MWKASALNNYTFTGKKLPLNAETENEMRLAFFLIPLKGKFY